jgi:hypothetical protein
MTQTYWVVLATSCPDCGSTQAIGLFNDKPTERDKVEVADTIGGMYCIKTSEVKIRLGDIVGVEGRDRT